jgi:LuxR family maltose regulon positive regulatory protein
MADLVAGRASGTTPWALLETKLHPPVVHTDLVPRPHLYALLDGAAPHSLTVVSAPTGYGKTTLLGSWARRSSVPVAWLTLEASDSDPARLLQYIVAALMRAEIPVAQSTQRSATAPGADLLGVVLPRLINDVAAQGASGILILDDFHTVSEPRCHELLARLISNRPQALRIVLATRSDPPLPLGRWRAARELLEVRQAQLRFDEAEADRFKLMFRGFNDITAQCSPEVTARASADRPTPGGHRSRP